MLGYQLSGSRGGNVGWVDEEEGGWHGEEGGAQRLG